MDNRLPNILQAAFFALTLVIAGVAHSTAQGAMASAKPGVFTMVICSGDGAVTVFVDGSGQPVEPSQADTCALCPACMFNADASPYLPAPSMLKHGVARHSVYREPGTVSANAEALFHPARGPPNEI
ncbi:MAG: hypothetical protein U5K36_11745 [Roseovarius sp.]|nr:hypothetical protein [Roseovarius sp.]